MGTFIDEYNALSARIAGLYGVAQSVGAEDSMPSALTTYNLSGYIGSIPGYKHFSDYVQDGLVLGWDGIENAGVGTHASSLSALYDHSGNGYSGVIYSSASGNTLTPALSGAVFNNGVYVNGSGAMIQCDNATEISAAISNLEITIEVLMQRLDYSSDDRWAIWACAAGTGTLFASAPRVYYVNTNTPGYAWWKGESVSFPSAPGSLPRGTMGTMTSIGKPRGFEQWLNGVLRTSYTQDNTTQCPAYNYFRVGGLGGKGSSLVDLNFHCARVYNRILTPAEIAHNRKVDVARFNIQTQVE